MDEKKRLVPISAKIEQDLKIALTKKAGELGVTVSELVGTYIAGGYSGDYSGTENGGDLALEVVTLMQDHFPILSSAGDWKPDEQLEDFEITALSQKVEDLEAEKAELLELSKSNEGKMIIDLPKEHKKNLEKAIKSVQKIMKEDKPNLSDDEAIQYLLLHGCEMCEHDTGFFGNEYKIKEALQAKK